MVSQELSVSLGIGLTLAVVLGILLCHACKQQFAPRLQADPESGQGISGVRSSGGPSGFPNHISHTLSRQPWPRASILVDHVERRHTVLGSRQPLTDLNVAQSHHSHVRSQNSPREAQSVPSTSRRTRPRRQTHPSAYVSGQELRATERTDIPTNGPQNPHTEPTVDFVEDGSFDPIATAYVQELPPLPSDGGTPTSTSSTDSDSDPRLSPDDGLGPTTEARTKSRLHLYHRRTKHEPDNGASDEAETASPTTLTSGTDSPPTSSNRSPPVILPLQDANAVQQTAATTDGAPRYDLDLEAKQAGYSMTAARELSFSPLPLWLFRPLQQMLDDRITEKIRDRCQ
ncbi:MAG: hypothetical protein LQ349_006970, partial [Xanthoria aureola]